MMFFSDMAMYAIQTKYFGWLLLLLLLLLLTAAD
jgi:hypothetical protein